MQANGYSVPLTRRLNLHWTGYIGYKKLKQKQEKVLRAFVSGNDVFAALPTGYGKSRAIAPPTSELWLLPLDFTAFCVLLDLVYSSRNIDTQLRFDKPTWPAAVIQLNARAAVNQTEV